MDDDDPALRLARFAQSARPGGDALAMMRLSLLDWTACAVAGAAEPVAAILRGAEGAAVAGGASVAGQGGRVPARAAALVNGATSHALDHDDIHLGPAVHPSVAVLPAALAVAEVSGATGTEFLTAALVGAEAAVRVGLWLGRGHDDAGFHITATAGAFGAALAAGRLLGLDAAGLARAVGIAATRASGLRHPFGTMGEPLNAGIAAEAGVMAARLAAAGLVSDPGAFAGPRGFGPTHAGAADPAAFEGLGRTWEMLGVAHKVHACCHGLHAMLEALAEVRLAPGAVDRVTVRTHPRWLTVCNIPAPATGLEARFSYRLAAALALAGRDTAAPAAWSDASCRDPELAALRDRVSVLGDAGLPETAVEVHLDAAGRSHVLRHDLARPLPRAAREARVAAKARALLGEAGAAAAQAAAAAPDGPDIAALGAILRAAPTRRG
jgi:2-methylcitrate dehydratase PrpD